MLGNEGVKLKEKNNFKDFKTGKLEKLLKKDTTQRTWICRNRSESINYSMLFANLRNNLEAMKTGFICPSVSL